jgi:hypothetical protein
MSAAESRSVLDRWLAAWNSHEIEALVALVTDDYKRRDPSMPDMDGPDAQRKLVTALIAAFPDLHFEETHRIASSQMPRGGTIVQPIAIQFPAVQLPHAGQFHFRVTVDGQELGRIPFGVRAVPFPAQPTNQTDRE